MVAEIRRAASRRGCRTRCFNGAATNWSRKYSAIREPQNRGHDRFNGAATNWSRKSPALSRTRPGVFMLQWGRDQLVAEIPCCRYVSRVGYCSFNGAATNWSRKSCGRGTTHRKEEKLQWGRDQLVAEIRVRLQTLQAAAPLQWGRDQLVAEIQLVTASTRGTRPASMGPRPIGRGNLRSTARSIGWW